MRQLYLDCDGVLADFDKGATAILGLPPRAYEKRHGLALRRHGLPRAKGILVASVTIPGKGPVTVATTHLNSRAASGAPWRRTHVAYAHQADFIADFVKVRATPPPAPLIIAGDFNRGQRPVRQAALQAALGPDVREGLRERLAQDARPFGHPSDARWIRQHARDMQLVFDGARARLQVVGAEIPFGTESHGSQLSDHMGFTIHYRINPTIPR